MNNDGHTPPDEHILDEHMLDEHILFDLGFGTTHVGDEVHGSALIVPEMFVPGTNALRTSILATWTDVAAGHLVVGVLAPRVPVTLDLDVHLYHPLRGTRTINAVARTIKVGRSVVVATVDFTGSEGESLAVGTASFMAVSDPAMTMPEGRLGMAGALRRQGSLTVPFAERAQCEVRGPGVALLPRTASGLNASNSLNGGLIALAVEEAALSLSPGATLASMSLRYLRPVRVGPAVASARVRAGLGSVEVRDEGSGNRLAVFAVTKAFGGFVPRARRSDNAAVDNAVVAVAVDNAAVAGAGAGPGPGAGAGLHRADESVA